MTGPAFSYDPAIVDRFPAVVGGVVHVTGLVNELSSEALVADYETEQAAVAAMLAERPIAELPSIAAWRRTFTACGVKPTQHRVAAEALLRRLHKAGNIPSINALVDIGNIVSIRHALPVAMFDQAAVSGATTVRFATGDERFTDLGASEAAHPDADEVIFVDDAGLVSARRWCWRQSAQSATGPATTTIIATIEAQHDGGRADIENAVGDLVDLLRRHQPQAEATAVILDGTNSSVEF